MRTGARLCTILAITESTVIRQNTLALWFSHWLELVRFQHGSCGPGIATGVDLSMLAEAGRAVCAKLGVDPVSKVANVYANKILTQ